MKQKIAFLYLNTGGGHVAPAKALAGRIAALYPDSETVLFNGFDRRQWIARGIFEEGYRITSNYFEPGYVLFYQVTSIPQNIRTGNYFVSLKGLPRLVKFLRDEGITKVVCLHEVLIIMARRAIDRVNPAIRLVTLVTDPFTAHPLWFYEKNLDLVVFSEKLRRVAVERHGFPAERLHVFPFILNPVYDARYGPAAIGEARRRLGIPEGKKVILVAGGGEGLRGAERIVRRFVSLGREEYLVVVCGRNRLLRRQTRLIAERASASNVLVFGFVDFMPDLLNIADAVITKAGASTVLEVLATGKPAIFSTYIRGQELGNVLYAVHNGVAWYIRKPREILEKAFELTGDETLRDEIRKRIDGLGIRNGLEEMAAFIHDL